MGIDICDGPNVDTVGDAHHLSRCVEGKFDYIFSVSVFEHLLMPWMAALEMNKVMSAGGYAYIGSHGAWPLHEQPWDFWRYSNDAWHGIFNSHTGFRVVKAGQALRCSTVPDYSSGTALQGIDRHPSYLLSACLVQKTDDAKVQWDADASEVYNLNYNHA